MDTMKTTYIVLELIIAVLSIAGNVLVCWAVAINSTLKNATNYFLVSLAVADIAVGLLAIPFAITISIGFQVDFHSCLFFACFVLVLTQSSIFSLLAVAIDRYLAIKIPLRKAVNLAEPSLKRRDDSNVCWVEDTISSPRASPGDISSSLSTGAGQSCVLPWLKPVLVTAVGGLGSCNDKAFFKTSKSLPPIEGSSQAGAVLGTSQEQQVNHLPKSLCVGIEHRYNSLVTGKRARGLIAVLWLLSFGIGLTPLMGWNKAMSGCPNATNETGADTGTEHHGCFISCLFENVVTMSYMVYFNFFGCVLLPLVIMLGIYIKIFMVACKQLHQIELMGNSRTTLQKEVHAAKSLAIIVGLFAFCWLPLHILNCITHFHEEFSKSKPEWVMYMAIILSHANSVINPIIYAYRIRDFRYTFRKIISKILCKTDDFPKCTTDNNQHLAPTLTLQ
ncbi:hypothetical protein QYF61_009075 [Mycteria americana]|uniref:G-protein coupled receptors family 1 profile domain-containing protein n=1 Tax=Mycteria americana TaxID=33587 RepID=A0AAN7NJS9_MYCAM|nr:hypothetical protein QYF61_009075 [Mycteria americana]